MAKFKVGDKVRILDGSNIKNYRGGFTFDMKHYIGETATIRGVSEREPIGYYLKEYSYIWDERGLELAKPETIVIYRKGNEVIALDKSTGKKATARCCPEDTFNFETGAKLAFERLIGEDKPTYYNGKIIFTKGDDVFKTGHIYEVKDGKIKDPRDYTMIPRCGGQLRDLEDVRDFFTGTGERKRRSGWSWETLELIEVKYD